MKPKKEKYFFEYEREAKAKKDKARIADKKATPSKSKTREMRGYIAPAKPTTNTTAKTKPKSLASKVGGAAGKVAGSLAKKKRK